MRYRSPAVTLMLIVATGAAGYVIRFIPLGLPAPVMKYGGSALWALLFYRVVSAAFRRGMERAAGGVAGLLTAGIECFKLYDPPRVDAFRHTLFGVLVLGRIFSWTDILAYWLAIAAGVVIDRRLRRT